MGYEKSSFYGINRLGQAVGKFSNYDPVADQDIDRQAIVWDPVNGVVMLPTLFGQTATWAINDSGQIAGYSHNEDGHKRAVRWDYFNSITDLGTLYNPEPQPDGQWGDNSEARNINNLGQITGNSDLPNDDGSFIPYHAFLYNDPEEGMQDLGTLTTENPLYQHGYSIGYSISDQGRIVGLAHTLKGGEWVVRPFIYDETSGMEELGINPDYPLNQWTSAVINGNGNIGGYVIDNDGKSRPYYWVDQEVAEPLPVAMPVEFPYGEIYGINLQGQMVGMMWNDAEIKHAFMLDIIHGVQDLNEIADLNPGDIILESALEINDSGQIVGISKVDGQTRGFILNILDSPCQGDLDYDGDVDGLDLAAYATGGGISLEVFAAEFGRTNCSME